MRSRYLATLAALIGAIIGVGAYASKNAEPVIKDNAPIESKIAFASKRGGNWEIYTMNADGSEQKRLTNNSV